MIKIVIIQDVCDVERNACLIFLTAQDGRTTLLTIANTSVSVVCMLCIYISYNIDKY